MPPKQRKNRYKIRCLECNVEMDFDYKKKHNSKFHQDLLTQRKCIRYNVVGAPKNPFEAAAGKSLKPSKTGVCTETQRTALQDAKHGDDEPKSHNQFLTEVGELSDTGDTELSLRPELPVGNHEPTLPDDRTSGPSTSSIKRHFDKSVDKHTSPNFSNEQKRQKIDEETHYSASDSDSVDSESSCDSGSTNVTTEMESGHRNLSAIKEDCELAGMLGDVIELLEEGNILRGSFEGEGYCEEVFMSSVEDFASELKKKSHFLLSLTKEAMKNEAEKLSTNSVAETFQTDSCVVSNDPAERKGIQLSEPQKYFLISKGPYQPTLENYPCNNVISKSKQNSFSSKWYETFPYLEYSPSLDRAYCFACSLFGDGAGLVNAETNWSTNGVNRWDKMKSRGKSKKDKLLEHFTSASHKLSAERLVHFKHKSSHVDVAISSAGKELLAQKEQERLRNRKVINLLLDCCRYLSRQALAFRGGDDDVNGNFKQLVNLLSSWVPFLKNWMATARSRPCRVTYLSPHSQNEFITMLGHETRKILVEQIYSSGVYAVMADTTPDVSHVDQISLIIRFVDGQFDIQERLLKISEINVKTGDGFAEKVINMLNALQIPLIGVRFQCYDTTASMSGAYNGAQAKLSERIGRPIPYITCLGHKTNLCVEHSCKASLMIEEFFTTLQELYNFLTKSTGRFGKLKERIDNLQEGLVMKNLSKTRWIGRAESIKAVWVSYEILIDILDDIKNSGDGDRDARRTASNLLDRIMSFEFYLSILFMKNIMYKTKIVVLDVQEIDQDILASLDVIRQTRDAMLRIREDDLGLDGIVTAAAEKCKSFGIDAEYEFSKKHRRRRPPIRIDENTDNANVPLFRQHYRQEIFKVVDRLVLDIDDINKYLSSIVIPVTVLLPQQIVKCTKQQVDKLCATFPNDLTDPDALFADIDMMGNDIEKSGAKNLRDAAKCLLGKQRFYPSLAKAYQLALTIPVSVASNERSFSKLRLVKNYLRSTMKEDRLDDLMILSSANDILDCLDLDKLADSWSICKTRKVKI